MANHQPILQESGILLAIALAGPRGPGSITSSLALVAVGWVGYARLARARVPSLAQLDHVVAARALDCGSYRILFRHLIPLALAPLVVEATFGLAAAVIAEAGLSFLGLGVQPPDASWGNRLRVGVSFMLVAPHLALWPPGSRSCSSSSPSTASETPWAIVSM
jgi:peptide/nickel transport system permease protein